MEKNNQIRTLQATIEYLSISIIHYMLYLSDEKFTTSSNNPFHIREPYYTNMISEILTGLLDGYDNEREEFDTRIELYKQMLNTKNGNKLVKAENVPYLLFEEKWTADVMMRNLAPSDLKCEVKFIEIEEKRLKKVTDLSADKHVFIKSDGLDMDGGKRSTYVADLNIGWWNLDTPQTMSLDVDQLSINDSAGNELSKLDVIKGYIGVNTEYVIGYEGDKFNYFEITSVSVTIPLKKGAISGTNNNERRHASGLCS